MSSWFPCLKPHTVRYLCIFPTLLLLLGVLGLLAPSCSSPHRRPVVGLQKCTVAFSISPRLDHRPRPGEHSIHQPTSPPRGASCTGPSSSLVMLLMSKMHWTGLNRTVQCTQTRYFSHPL